MQNTSNYNLNIVEGTDIVNIPVQLNPNFQTIDAEMFKNKQGSIGTATEVVTGTVHAIVRANTDADVFRFTATGAWTAGDTMTLDGSAVTVHLADGTAPTTGAYIIGAEVVAVVNGTLVTLLTSNGAVDPGVTSFNSRTGSVIPQTSDYDASMIDYDNTGSGLVATDAQSAIDELAAKKIHYDTLATASGGQSYSAQLASLKTTFDTLSADDKDNCILASGGSIYNPTSTGKFVDVVVNSANGRLTSYDIVAGTVYEWSSASGTVSDYSSSTNPSALALKIMKV